MKKYLVLFLLLILSINVAEAEAGTYRDLQIQKELDWFSKHTSLDDSTLSMPINESPTNKLSANKPEILPIRVHSFNISHQVFYDAYSQPKTQRWRGIWQGFEGKYIYRPPHGTILNTPVINFYSLEGMYAWGKNTRTRLTPPLPEMLKFSNIPGAMFEARVLIGRDFHISNTMLMTPYAGYGYRYRADKAGGHQDILSDGGPFWGYDQNTMYRYIPLGLTMDINLKNNYELSFNIEYDLFLKGIVRKRFSDIDQFSIPLEGVSNQDVRFYQKKGFGLRGSFKFLKHFSLMDVYVQPFVRYWYIKDSKGAMALEDSAGPPDPILVNFRENKNNTLEGGIKTGLQF